MEEEEKEELDSDELSCDDQPADQNKTSKATNMKGEEQTLVLSPMSPKELAYPLALSTNQESILDKNKSQESTLCIDSGTTGTNHLTLIVPKPLGTAQSLICHVPHFYHAMMQNNVKDEVLKQYFLRKKD